MTFTFSLCRDNDSLGIFLEDLKNFVGYDHNQSYLITNMHVLLLDNGLPLLQKTLLLFYFC